jgi:IS5 family transposase
MRRTMQGKDRYFGMKAHVRTDLNGLVHAVVTGDAAQGGFKQPPKHLHEQDRALYGQRAYWSEIHRVGASRSALRLIFQISPQKIRHADQG